MSSGNLLEENSVNSVLEEEVHLGSQFIWLAVGTMKFIEFKLFDFGTSYNGFFK